MPVGSHPTAPELGISTVLLRRPVAAGAFLLGLPEGGVSELEALPAASRSLGQIWYRQAAITAVPGWVKWARISKYFDLPQLGSSIQNSGDKEEGKVLRIEYVFTVCSTWTWLILAM